MTAFAIVSPFPQFFDKQGSPLESGYVFIGTANANPETSAITAYWDSALTQPAAQPLRTSAGVIVRSGTPATVYVNSDYSMTVRDGTGAFVSYMASATAVNVAQQFTQFVADLLNSLNTAKGAALVGYRGRTVYDRLSDSICILDKGGINGSGDSTTAFQDCLDLGGGVYIPDGMTFYVSAFDIRSFNRIHGGGTLKKLAASGLSATVHYWGDGSTASYWSIDGPILDGNRDNQSGTSGYKIRGLLVRECSYVDIHPRHVLNWQDGFVEATCSSQPAPTNAYTPPADPADAIYTTKIHGFTAYNCGRFVDDGSGYSDSKLIQVGSTTRGVAVYDIDAEECTAIVLFGAYNHGGMIDRIRGYNTPSGSAWTYAGTMVAVEQLSLGCVVGIINGEGFTTLMNIESAIGITIGTFRGSDCKNGVSIFASDISGTDTDMGKVTVAGGQLEGRGTTSGTFGFRCTLSGSTAAYKAVIGAVQSANFHDGNQISGITGGSASLLYAEGCVSGNIVTGNSKFLVAEWHAKDCTSEGMYVGAANDGVTIRGGKASGCAYGAYIADGQTDLRFDDNDLDGANSTADFYIANASANQVKHRRIRYSTQTGALRTLSGVAPSVKWGGDEYLVTNGSATTMTGLTDMTVGRTIRLVATDANTTLQQNPFYLRGVTNLNIPIHSGVSLACLESGKYAEV